VHTKNCIFEYAPLPAVKLGRTRNFQPQIRSKDKDTGTDTGLGTAPMDNTPKQALCIGTLLYDAEMVDWVERASERCGVTSAPMSYERAGSDQVSLPARERMDCAKLVGLLLALEPFVVIVLCV
jgi:hypothetical protein